MVSLTDFSYSSCSNKYCRADNCLYKSWNYTLICKLNLSYNVLAKYKLQCFGKNPKDSLFEQSLPGIN